MNIFNVPKGIKVPMVGIYQELKHLREENQYLHAVINSLPGSVYWKDRQGKYLGRNAYAASSMHEFGFESNSQINSIIGKLDHDLFSKEDADQYRHHDTQVMLSRKTISLEETVKKPNGETVTQLSTKTPLIDDAGQVQGVIGNTVDITHLKEVEHALHEALTKAESANHSKTEFIRNMEHDIRTPFTGIYMIAIELMNSETDQLKREYLQDIVVSAKSLLDYCNNIIDYVRVDEGSVPKVAESFDLIELLNNVILIETPVAKHKNICLTANFDGNIPQHLVGDHFRINRVVMNLVSNAIKFTHEGSVVLSASLKKLEADNTALISITVKDTGIGIPEDKMAFIYEKFSRLSPSNNGVYKGQGLGLSTVKQLMRELGGQITVDSKVGEGAAFTCTIPLQINLEKVDLFSIPNEVGL